jgi:hypothetical protein
LLGLLLLQGRHQHQHLLAGRLLPLLLLHPGRRQQLQQRLPWLPGAWHPTQAA